MKTWWAVIFAVFISLLASGVIYLVSSQPRGKPVELQPPPTQSPIIVHITGAVKNPGVYSLPANSRVEDGINAAGGATTDADLETVNLASFLNDGDKIQIPSHQENQTIAMQGQSQTQIATDQANQSSDSKININTASKQELESLPGIGPATAAKIITYREENGLFATIEDIQNVSGIGPVTFNKFKDLITTQ